MLSNQPCKNVRFIHRDARKGENFLIGQLDPTDDTEKYIKSFGAIIGCAIYFKQDDTQPEQIVATGLRRNHGDITNFLIVEDGFEIELMDDEKTCYGFITNSGYFLNRKLALLAYRHFCQENRVTPPLVGAHTLYSYSINWNAVVTVLDIRK